ncbi:MAG: dehydrogenase [Acidobacteria bacterium]|nr:MAG: dehydrogenase [Acidobacteriota bacterium]PYR82631.1 MAG: dehydrogenase [Acidobacteriota bacterium]
MKFMVIVKADKKTEAGVMPTEQELATMGKYNQQLIDAGVLVDAAGLQRSSKGARVGFKDGKVVVTDGPFAETKELIAGYWIINVKSRAEAIEWAKKIPFQTLPNDGREPEVEIRQFFEIEDFPNAPAEVVEQEKKHFGRK